MVDVAAKGWPAGTASGWTARILQGPYVFGNSD
jgi:hypothetical protein